MRLLLPSLVLQKVETIRQSSAQDSEEKEETRKILRTKIKAAASEFHVSIRARWAQRHVNF